ncbi:MAG: YceI family protein [Balneolaceae bacterium]
MTGLSIMGGLSFGLEEVAHAQLTYVPEESSRLWIEGKSNVNEFECQANQYFAEATLIDDNDPIEFQQQLDARVFMQLEIQVDGFECGRSRMNKDLQAALKSSEFPEITFEFDNASILNLPENNNVDNAFEIEVNGTLSVAGNSRDIHFTTKAYFVETYLIRAIGKTTIQMSDFNVEPPVALMGLVKVEDELTVNFDLYAVETQAICQICPSLLQN